MKIHSDHLLRFIKSKPSLDEISKNLFQLGHEHDLIEGIFDFEFTPNRGDCLSLKGLSRDLGVFYNLCNDLKIYEYDIPELKLNFLNLAKLHCPKISFLKVKIQSNEKRYQNYLDDYFKDLKINKNNLFTDISNYLAYELGQPTHCYDYSKLGNQITLKLSKDVKQFKTLLGQKIDLNGENLLFYSDNDPINLAGIIGGESTACSENTSEVLIECAYFKPDFLMGKSSNYNVNSDAAHKFERNVDHNSHDFILRRFIQILSEHAEITELELFTHIDSDIKDREIDLDIPKINKILGLNISDTKIKSIFKKLEFDFNEKRLIVPSYRNDINNLNDLAEEVARVYGYDNIPEKEIQIPQRNTIIDQKENTVKSFLIDKGFYECINNPFTNLYSENSIEVDNPLDSTRKYLRYNLKESLLNNLAYNSRRQQDSIKLFELSDIYTFKKDVIVQSKILGIIASGRVAKNYKDFLKIIDLNYLNSTFEKLFDTSKNKFNTISSEVINLKAKHPIYYAEINLQDLNKNINEYKSLTAIPKKFKKFEGISEFPTSSRDLSFLVESFKSIKSIEDIIYNLNINELKEVFAFDFYENPKKNQIKIGFRFIFQSKSKTLMDDEVDDLLEEIIKPCLIIDGVSIPGI